MEVWDRLQEWCKQRHQGLDERYAAVDNKIALLREIYQNAINAQDRLVSQQFSAIRDLIENLKNETGVLFTKIDQLESPDNLENEKISLKRVAALLVGTIAVVSTLLGIWYGIESRVRVIEVSAQGRNAQVLRLEKKIDDLEEKYSRLWQRSSRLRPGDTPE